MNCCFLVDPAYRDEVRAGVRSVLTLLSPLTAGEVDSVEDWGAKACFEIDDLIEGDYTPSSLHADPTQIAELDRVLRINDAVKRHMIVRRVGYD